MAYRLIYTATALKQLEALDRQLQRRAVAKIEPLATTPRPAGCVKLSGKEHVWRVRVGDYRVVYEVYDDAELVRITVIAHRREVYRD